MYEYLHPSKHKTRHCTNGIKMFCVCWAGKKTIAMFLLDVVFIFVSVYINNIRGIFMKNMYQQVLKTSDRDSMMPTRQGGRRRTGFKYSDSSFTQQNYISGLSVVFISPPLCRTHIR